MKFPTIFPLMSCLVIQASQAQEAPDIPHAFDAGWEGKTTCELLYETDSVRVGKCVFPPGVGHEEHYHNPHFGYTLEGSTLRITDSSGVREVEIPTGSSWSTDTVTRHEAMNIGETTTSYLIVEPKPWMKSGAFPD